MADLGAMLKGFTAKLAGDNAIKDAQTILDYTIKSNTSHAASTAKLLGNIFLGSKYATGAADWIRYGNASKMLNNIAGEIAKTENLAEVLKGTGLEGLANNPQYLKDVFTQAAGSASSLAASGKSALASRFTNKAGEVGFRSMARATARISAPIFGVVVPLQIAGLANNAVSMAVPQNPAAAAQVAGQQW